GRADVLLSERGDDPLDPAGDLQLRGFLAGAGARADHRDVFEIGERPTPRVGEGGIDRDHGWGAVDGADLHASDARSAVIAGAAAKVALTATTVGEPSTGSSSTRATSSPS